MGLADDLAWMEQPARCRLGAIIAEADKADAAAIERAIEVIREHRAAKGQRSSSGPNCRWLCEKLEANNLIAPRGAVEAHVARRCACVRRADGAD